MSADNPTYVKLKRALVVAMDGQGLLPDDCLTTKEALVLPVLDAIWPEIEKTAEAALSARDLLTNMSWADYRAMDHQKAAHEWCKKYA